jgi:hypothetical protein
MNDLTSLSRISKHLITYKSPDSLIEKKERDTYHPSRRPVCFLGGGAAPYCGAYP